MPRMLYNLLHGRASMPCRIHMRSRPKWRIEMHNGRTEMLKTVNIERITSLQFSLLIEMIKTLLESRKINRDEADITAQRIASEYELSPIYLW